MGFCTFGFADDHHNASFFRETHKIWMSWKMNKIYIVVKLLQRTVINDSQEICIADYLKEIGDSLWSQIMGFGKVFQCEDDRFFTKK
jgi:hypothetical protein